MVPPPSVSKEHVLVVEATILSGRVELAASLSRLESTGARVAVLGRDGASGPVHSSTAGPGHVGAIPPPGGTGWWKTFDPEGRSRRLRFVDGAFVVLGNARGEVEEIVAPHPEDAIRSALARLAERFELPDSSAEEVVERIDSGELGILLLGSLEVRMRALGIVRDGASAISEARAA